MPLLSFSQYLKIGGKIFATVSLILIGLCGNLYLRGHAVKVEITSLSSKISDENVMTYSPSFRIAAGEFSNKRYRLPYRTSTSPGKRGDILDGKYDPFTQRVLSNTIALNELELSFYFLGVGLIFGFIDWEKSNALLRNWKF